MKVETIMGKGWKWRSVVGILGILGLWYYENTLVSPPYSAVPGLTPEIRELIKDKVKTLPASAAPLIAKATESNKKIVILITGRGWCPTSNDADTNIFKTAEWQTFAQQEVIYYEEIVKPIPIDVDLTNPPLAMYTSTVPTLLVASSDGRVRGKISPGNGRSMKAGTELFSNLIGLPQTLDGCIRWVRSFRV